MRPATVDTLGDTEEGIAEVERGFIVVTDSGPGGGCRRRSGGQADQYSGGRTADIHRLSRRIRVLVYSTHVQTRMAPLEENYFEQPLLAFTNHVH